jgi:hypothetical protein
MRRLGQIGVENDVKSLGLSVDLFRYRISLCERRRRGRDFINSFSRSIERSSSSLDADFLPSTLLGPPRVTGTLGSNPMMRVNSANGSSLWMSDWSAFLSCFLSAMVFSALALSRTPATSLGVGPTSAMWAKGDRKLRFP